MSFYSEQMAHERQQIVEQLKSELSQLTLMLQAAGIYAEAIDPSNGQFLMRQEQLKTPICESDERLAQLAQFELEDVGCCRILKHAQYGAHAITGLMFIQ